MELADPRTAINEILAILTALTLPLSFGDPAVTAFDKVKIFDLEDLPKAFEELFLYGNRVALIGIDGVDHDTHSVGRSLQVKRGLQLLVLFSDRRFADRVKALMGEGNLVPGILLLQTLMVNAVGGELASGSIVTPGRGTLVSLQDQSRADLGGRIIFSQPFSVSIDFDSVELTRGARLAGPE